jgi:hypothetical protein
VPSRIHCQRPDCAPGQLKAAGQNYGWDLTTSIRDLSATGASNKIIIKITDQPINIIKSIDFFFDAQEVLSPDMQ